VPIRGNSDVKCQIAQRGGEKEPDLHRYAGGTKGKLLCETGQRRDGRATRLSKISGRDSDGGDCRGKDNGTRGAEENLKDGGKPAGAERPFPAKTGKIQNQEKAKATNLAGEGRIEA